MWQATIKYAVAEAFSFNFKPTLVLARGAARARGECVRRFAFRRMHPTQVVP